MNEQIARTEKQLGAILRRARKQAGLTQGGLGDRIHLRQGTIASADAEAVAGLRAAGAVVLGTTNCPEFLMAYETANLLHGGTANPIPICVALFAEVL